MPGSTLNHPKRVWRWKRKTVALMRVEKRREMARKRGKRRKLRKTTLYQRRSQRRRARFFPFLLLPLFTVIKPSYVNCVLISEGRASRAGANSGRVASLCLDHRHGPSQKSLHTPDGRWSTHILFYCCSVLDRRACVRSYKNTLVFYVVTRLKVTYKSGLACLIMTPSSSFLLNSIY